MGCMGPSYDEGIAKEVAEKCLALLAKRGVGNGKLDRPNSRLQFNDSLKQDLLRVLEEICWDDACASF